VVQISFTARLPEGSPEEDSFRAEQNIKSQPVPTEMQQQWKVELSEVRLRRQITNESNYSVRILGAVRPAAYVCRGVRDDGSDSERRLLGQGQSRPRRAHA
jgi:hypothetical protein